MLMLCVILNELDPRPVLSSSFQVAIDNDNPVFTSEAEDDDNNNNSNPDPDDSIDPEYNPSDMDIDDGKGTDAVLTDIEGDDESDIPDMKAKKKSAVTKGAKVLEPVEMLKPAKPSKHSKGGKLLQAKLSFNKLTDEEMKAERERVVIAGKVLEDMQEELEDMAEEKQHFAQLSKKQKILDQTRSRVQKHRQRQKVKEISEGKRHASGKPVKAKVNHPFESAQRKEMLTRISRTCFTCLMLTIPKTTLQRLHANVGGC
jgi:hypothetical protein